MELSQLRVPTIYTLEELSQLSVPTIYTLEILMRIITSSNTCVSYSNGEERFIHISN